MIAWPLPRSCTRFEGGGHRHRPQRTAAISRTASTTRWMVGVSRVEGSNGDRTCCTTECSPKIPPIDYTQEKWTGLTFQTISAFRTYMCKRLFRSVSCFVATIDVPGFRTHLDSQCENIARLHSVNIVFSFSVPLLSLLLFLLLVLCLFWSSLEFLDAQK